MVCFFSSLSGVEGNLEFITADVDCVSKSIAAASLTAIARNHERGGAYEGSLLKHDFLTYRPQPASAIVHDAAMSRSEGGGVRQQNRHAEDQDTTEP